MGRTYPAGSVCAATALTPDLVRRRLPQTWSGGDRTGRRIEGPIGWARGPRNVGRSLPSVGLRGGGLRGGGLRGGGLRGGVGERRELPGRLGNLRDLVIQLLQVSAQLVLAGAMCSPRRLIVS